MAHLKQQIEQVIKSNRVTIFSKSYCPYCKMAKQAFNELNEPFYAIELDTREDGDLIQAVLKKKTKVNTVPQVFIHGRYIGGGNDIQRLHSEGKLLPLILGEL